jgi:hypothetical protein
MALTRDFNETIVVPVRRDLKLYGALPNEGIRTPLTSDVKGNDL